MYLFYIINQTMQEDNEIVGTVLCLKLGKILEGLIASTSELSSLDKNKQPDLNNSDSSVFDSITTPNIGLSEYIEHLVEELYLTHNMLIYGIILLSRYLKYSDICLTKKNCFKLLGVAMVLSFKINSDYRLKPTFSDILCFKAKDYDTLEAIYLETIGYKLFVTNGKFSEYFNKIMAFNAE